jgi:hypothetical protein
MKWRSSLVDELSGSMGGRTASVARGGIGYFRSRVIPRNPNTLLQSAVRAALSSASVYWNTILSEADREAWWDLAEGGQTGQSLFTKANQARIYAVNSNRTVDSSGAYTELDVPIVTVPPESSATNLTTPSPIVIDDSANTLSVTVSQLDDWNAETVPTDAASMLAVYASHQQSASRNSRQHPFQALGFVVRPEADPTIATPIVFNLATHGFTTQAGKVMYLKFIAYTSDGRVSSAIITRVTITA